MTKVISTLFTVVIFLFVSVVLSFPNNLPQNIDLNVINSQDIAVINGIDKNDRLGRSICVGDINNDRYDDIIISAIWADPLGRKILGKFMLWGAVTICLLQ